MTDNDRRRAERAAWEYTETNDAVAQVKAAYVARLFASPIEAAQERERLYQAVQILDQVRARMTILISSASDSKAIEAYAAAVRDGSTQI